MDLTGKPTTRDLAAGRCDAQIVTVFSVEFPYNQMIIVYEKENPQDVCHILGMNSFASRGLNSALTPWSGTSAAPGLRDRSPDYYLLLMITPQGYEVPDDRGYSQLMYE